MAFLLKSRRIILIIFLVTGTITSILINRKLEHSHSKNYSIFIDVDKDLDKKLIGQDISDISLKDLSGQTWFIRDINSQLKIIILFNPQDCPRCWQELILWKKIQNNFSPEEIFLIGIAYNSSKKEITSFIKKKDISFLILIDKKDKIRKHLGLKSSPWRILIDHNNKIIDIQRPTAEISKYGEFMSRLSLYINENKFYKRKWP